MGKVYACIIRNAKFSDHGLGGGKVVRVWSECVIYIQKDLFCSQVSVFKRGGRHWLLFRWQKNLLFRNRVELINSDIDFVCVMVSTVAE